MQVTNRVIQEASNILEALKLMDSSKTKLLFVFKEDKFQGLLTIGDIQRAILNDTDLTSSISSILDKNKIYAIQINAQVPVSSVSPSGVLPSFS